MSHVEPTTVERVLNLHDLRQTLAEKESNILCRFQYHKGREERGFVWTSTIVFRGGSTRGIGGLSPPYLPITHGYPPKPLLDFWDETMKRKRERRRREEEEEEESGHDPPLHF